MISQLLNAVFYLLLFLGLIWLAIALMSTKWPSWKPVSNGYRTLLKMIGLGIARYLWTPQFHREGAGEVARPRMPYQELEQ